MQITKEMTLEEIFTVCPQQNDLISEELRKMGLRCLGCHMASFESIEQGLQNHGFSEEDIDNFIDKINNIMRNYEK